MSHVWGRPEEEDTFVHVRGLSGAPIEERWSKLSPKVRDCCTYTAGRLGFEWVWIDTCCIDKSSSTELSEAINSMYRWYSSAAICLAYLHDVDDGVDRTKDRGPDWTVPRSNWFTRGWTLQELIAPKHVIFLSRGWSLLGSKFALASEISLKTGIDVSVLTGTCSCTEISVGRRFQWASWRKTTREEDQAYSLMGIFQIYMPVIYGEGGAALRRLQEEIIRTTSDHTLFTWTYDSLLWDLPGDHLLCDKLLRFSDRRVRESFPPQMYTQAIGSFAWEFCGDEYPDERRRVSNDCASTSSPTNLHSRDF